MITALSPGERGQALPHRDKQLWKADLGRLPGPWRTEGLGGVSACGRRGAGSRRNPLGGQEGVVEGQMPGPG